MHYRPLQLSPAAVKMTTVLDAFGSIMQNLLNAIYERWRRRRRR
jgi:hypothetical protein